jgi:hypothetical protein
MCDGLHHRPLRSLAPRHKGCSRSVRSHTEREEGRVVAFLSRHRHQWRWWNRGPPPKPKLITGPGL